jgi:hypothetical protein
VRRRVGAATERLLAEYLPRLLAGTAPRMPQDGARANRFRRRSAADGRFTWVAPAIDIYNLVRALVAPHPGAWAEHPGGNGREVFHAWRSLPEIVWLKSEHAGGFADMGSRWRLVARRPPRQRERRRANRDITLGVCGRYDRRERATIVLTGRDDWRMAECRIAPCGWNHRIAPSVLRVARQAARDFAAHELNGIAVVW